MLLLPPFSPHPDLEGINQQGPVSQMSGPALKETEVPKCTHQLSFLVPTTSRGSLPDSTCFTAYIGSCEFVS